MESDTNPVEDLNSSNVSQCIPEEHALSSDLVVPLEKWISISPKWVTYGRRHFLKLQSDWPDTFASLLEHLDGFHKLCTLVGYSNYTHCTYCDSRSIGKNTVKVILKCRRKPCSVKVHLVSQSSDDEGVRFKVILSGSSEHTSIEARNLRGERRKSEGFLMVQSNMCSSQRYFKMRCNPSIPRQQVPSARVLRQAKYEKTISSRLSAKNSTEWDELVLLYESRCSQRLIQELCYCPFRIMLFNCKSVGVLKSVARLCGRPWLTYDATGELFRTMPMCRGKDLMYHALVLRHPEPGQPQLAVASMITARSTTCDIAHFLHTVYRLNYDIAPTHIPAGFTCDFSFAIMNAAAQVFNGQTLSAYLTSMHYIVSKQVLSSDINKVVLLTIGRSHIMKTFVDWTSNTDDAKPKEAVKKMWRFCFALLVQQTTYEAFKVYFKMFIRMLVSTTIAPIALDFSNLQKAVLKQDDPCIQQMSGDIESNDPWIDNVDVQYGINFKNTVRQQSLFYMDLNSIFQDAIMELDCRNEVMEIMMDLNAYRCMSLAERLVTQLGPYVPMWSGICSKPERYSKSLVHTFQDLSHTGYTEGHSEGWMRIVKRDIANVGSCGRLNPSQFIKSMLSCYNGRIRHFVENIPCNKSGLSVHDSDAALSNQWSECSSSIHEGINADNLHKLMIWVLCQTLVTFQCKEHYLIAYFSHHNHCEEECAYLNRHYHRLYLRDVHLPYYQWILDSAKLTSIRNHFARQGS